MSAFTGAINRDFKPRVAIAAGIGHLKDDRLGSNHFPHAEGDAVNPVLAACYKSHGLVRLTPLVSYTGS